MSSNEKNNHKTILICSNFQNQKSDSDILNDLEEFKLLALTLDLSVVDSVVLNNLRT